MSTQSTTSSIPLDLIVPNPEQPRTHFDEAELEGLAQSIREEGVIQPIVVELQIPPSGGDTGGESCYILHDGERRWRAARLAGLADIPAVIVDPSDDETSQRDRLTRALVANIQRTDLTPLEVANAYQKMHDLGLSDQAIADKVGKSRSSVANARRLLELPEDVRDLANQDGISERIMMALLPIYQMPPEALDAAEQHWSSPQRLISEIKKGGITNSDQVRSRARSIIRDGTHSLSDNFPTGHEFEASDDIRSSRCDDCPLLVKVGKELRCPIKSCYEAKARAWQTSVMEAASEIHGILALPEDAEWNTYNSFYCDDDIVADIIANGCENLRLKFEQWAGSGSYRFPDYPKITVVCYHGTDDDKQCTCLQTARAKHPELAKGDEVRAERDRQRAEVQQLFDTCGNIVGQAVERQDVGIWRWMLSALMPHTRQHEEWGIPDICRIIGKGIVERHVSWDARQNPDLARSEIIEAFDHFGLDFPDISPAEDILRRFSRIQGWIAINIHHITGGDEQPSLEAIQGNLDNLLTLTDEFDAISHEQIANPAFDGFLSDLAHAVDVLDTCKTELNGRHHVTVGAQTPQEEIHA